MLYGCCVNLLPQIKDRTKIEYVPLLKEMGYDYVELPLNELAQLSEEEFHKFLDAFRKIGLPCRACNDFMPSEFQIVGDNITAPEIIMEYIERAMDRVRQLGASYTVFGSPWSRSCPEGFPTEKAFQQIAEFLRTAGDAALRHGAVIVIEHNNHGETNMLNHFSDAVRMARTVGHPGVKVLCDYYHLRVEQDLPDILMDGGEEYLRHTHIAQLRDRKYLTELSEEPLLLPYAKVLHSIGYNGGISIEARVKDAGQWRMEARENLKNMRSIFERI